MSVHHSLVLPTLSVANASSSSASSTGGGAASLTNGSHSHRRLPSHGSDDTTGDLASAWDKEELQHEIEEGKRRKAASKANDLSVVSISIYLSIISLIHLIIFISIMYHITHIVLGSTRHVCRL
jgi:hypothetical protein